MRSMCVGVAETGVNAFLFLTFAALLITEKREKGKVNLSSLPASLP